MNVFRLIYKEIAYRKLNFVFSLLAVVVAVSLFVAVFTTGSAYRRETRRLMRNMGQNLRIIPRETSIADFWLRGFSENTMPEEYMQLFAESKGFSYTHLTATLQKKVTWRNMDIILTGILPEVLPADRTHQKPMMFSVKPGVVYIGSEVAEKLSIKQDDVINILGKDFTVAKCLSISGSSDDIRIYGDLHDIQSVLDMKGEINEIKALECLCVIETSGDKVNPLELAKQQLAQILPQGQVILLQGIADIRQKQRAAMESYLSFVLPFVVVACGVWVAVLAMMNVRERQSEIGIMRAMGYNSGKIASLFLGKAILVGLIGAATGFAAGTEFALIWGPQMFKVTAKSIKPEYVLLGWSLIAAPAFAWLAGFIPMAIALANDPADTLRNP